MRRRYWYARRRLQELQRGKDTTTVYLRPYLSALIGIKYAMEAIIVCAELLLIASTSVDFVRANNSHYSPPSPSLPIHLRTSRTRRRRTRRPNPTQRIIHRRSTIRTHTPSIRPARDTRNWRHRTMRARRPRRSRDRTRRLIRADRLSLHQHRNHCPCRE